jgi:hypothetical protein
MDKITAVTRDYGTFSRKNPALPELQNPGPIESR